MVSMKKAAGAAGLVIKYMLFMGYAVQICLGLFWMAVNFTGIQDFAPVDTGIYPLFLCLAGNIHVLIYALQLGAALYAGYRLLAKLGLGGRGICLWGSLALMTLPMAMQCHMALLPYSLAGSLALLELSFACELADRKSSSCTRALAGILACYGAQCLLWPEYCMPGAVLPFLLLLWKLPGMLRRKGQAMRGAALALCFLAVAAGFYMGQAREEDGSFSGWRWKLVKRVCWPRLWEDFGIFWQGFGLDSETVIWVGSYYPHAMETELKPALEAAVAPEEADGLMSGMVERSWGLHYPMVIRQIGWDALGYGVTPLILPLQLAGDAYDSCSGRNYEIMRDGAPALTKYYVRTACGWSAAVLILAAAGAVLSCISGAARIRDFFPAGVVPVLAVLVSAGTVILIFTMQGAGIMDYKYTVWINQLWMAGSIKIMLGRRAERRDEHEAE